MSLKYIRETYLVPAKRGGKIRFRQRTCGVIVGSKGPYLRVRFGTDPQIHSLHPTWEVEYLERSDDILRFLTDLDDDMSKWPEHRKMPEASCIKHKETDFDPPSKS